MKSVAPMKLRNVAFNRSTAVRLLYSRRPW